MRCLELRPDSMFWADSKGSGMRVNGRSDPLTHVVYSCTDDCTAPHRPLSGESPLAKTKKFSSGSCVEHARQISNLQTPHQSKLQICCCIIHHIHNTLKLFSLYPIYKKKKKKGYLIAKYTVWREQQQFPHQVQSILWSVHLRFSVFLLLVRETQICSTKKVWQTFILKMLCFKPPEVWRLILFFYY